MPTPPPLNARPGKRLSIWVIVAAAIGVLLAVNYASRPRPAVIRGADVQRATRPARLDGNHPCVFAMVSSAMVKTATGQCATPTEHAIAEDRFEVDLRYGTFVLRQTDLGSGTAWGPTLDRAYSSNDWGSSSHLHAFGYNSSHNYDIGPTGTRRPYTWMTLRLEDSDFLYFPRISAGSSFEDAVYMHTETSTRFYGATIAWNGNGWTLRMRDGSEMLFPEAYLAKNLAQGAACERIDANGNETRLERDGQRNLTEVRTAQGHWIRLQHDGAGRIVQAGNDGGVTVQYRYNGDGMLEEMRRSNGTERHYSYDGRLMSAVTDEKGTTLVRNWYRSGRVVRQLFASGDIYTYDYDGDTGMPYVNSVVVTLLERTERRVDVTSSVSEFLRRN